MFGHAAQSLPHAAVVLHDLQVAPLRWNPARHVSAHAWAEGCVLLAHAKVPAGGFAGHAEQSLPQAPSELQATQAFPRSVKPASQLTVHAVTDGSVLPLQLEAVSYTHLTLPTNREV